MPTPTPNNPSLALALADVADETAAQLRVLARLPADELTGETDSFGLYLLLNRLATDLDNAERAYRPGEKAAHDPAEPPSQALDTHEQAVLDALRQVAPNQMGAVLAMLRGLVSHQGVPS